MAVRSITLTVVDEIVLQNPRQVQDFIARSAGYLLADILSHDGVDVSKPLWLTPEMHGPDASNYTSKITLNIDYTPYTSQAHVPAIDSRHERFPAPKKLNAGKKALGPSHSSDSIEA